MRVRTADLLVVGGGIVGLTLALEARRRHPGASIVLLEKEEACGRHASGRNSGVLHAGFYYTADSLKARLCRDGNRALTEYCLERDLPIRRCGKLVVARNPEERDRLDELLRRAEANGVDLREVSEEDALEIEPRARTCERALFSPSTSVVDPRAVVASLVADARDRGIEVRTGTPYRGRSGAEVRAGETRISAGYVINAAGLYADRIAREYGFSLDYRILPFKGLYLHGASDPGLGPHIYPVPELAYPFLGVHFTVTVDGGTKIGPTAIPAFWREQYRGLRNFRLGEMLEIGLLEAGLFLRDTFGFRRLARREISKYSRRRLVRRAEGLLRDELAARDWRWGKPGIRAQLVDVKERKLVMDFLFQGDEESFHVLNAVSPAFTCSIPFASFLWDRIEALTGASGGAARERTTVSRARQGPGVTARGHRAGAPEGGGARVLEVEGS